MLHLYICVFAFGCVCARWSILPRELQIPRLMLPCRTFTPNHARREAIKIINLRQTIRVVPCLVSLCGGVWAGNLKPFSNGAFLRNLHNEVRENLELS
jgi:hypothetical protein